MYFGFCFFIGGEFDGDFGECKGDLGDNGGGELEGVLGECKGDLGDNGGECEGDFGKKFGGECEGDFGK